MPVMPGPGVRTPLFVSRLSAMNEQSSREPFRSMSDSEFELLSGFIRTHSGISIQPSKKNMLELRLQKRLWALGLSSFSQYCGVLFDSLAGPGERVRMIDAVTTNKTEFFREPLHFRALVESVLPEYVGAGSRTGNGVFTAWSAGCSTGEEPYSLAIVLNEFAARNPGFRYAITATDISTEVLEKAVMGIYDLDEAATVPPFLMQKYFMRCKDRKRGVVRIVPELRSRVEFRRLNLMDEYSMPPKESMDAILCRNVIIYFERETQYRLLRCLCRSLRTGGHLFLGHSETVQGFDLPLVRNSSTMYGKVS